MLVREEAGEIAESENAICKVSACVAQNKHHEFVRQRQQKHPIRHMSRTGFKDEPRLR
jgi:hypothetical protein